MIPKVFHNIWLGGNMPDLHKYLIDRMLKMHPDWDYKLWTESNIPLLHNQRIYDSMNKLCFKADVLRYEIVLNHGGVYIDTDFLFLKNINELLYREALITREFPVNRIPNINNCIIGFPKQHEVMKFVVMKMQEVFEEKYERVFTKEGEHVAGLETVGPRFFDLCIRSFSPEIERNAFSVKYFSPFRPNTSRSIYKKYGDAYALHLWNHKFSSRNSIDIQKLLELQNS